MLPNNAGADALIRRRHVLYVEGYDPQGAEGYHNLFRRSFRRFLNHWPLRTSIGDLQIDSDDLAHWTVDAAGPNWQVATRYEFLRQELMIRANMAEPLSRQVPRALGWMLNYLFTGTLYRIYRASPRYGLALTMFQSMLFWWLAFAGLGGWLIGWLSIRFAGAPLALGVVVGVVSAIGLFKLLRPLADRLFVVQINNHWPYLLEYACGEPSCFDHPIEAGARRLVEIVRANDADEIVVIGHSGGGVIAPAVMARALELDPDLGRRGPRVVLFTPGSLMPGIGLHRGAVKVRAVIARIAVEPSIVWIDAKARADMLNFYNFDPVAGIGIDAGPKRCNPLIWRVRIREMLAPEFYSKLRWSMFRMHYQFIMANDMRAPYEYLMLVCGPVPVEQWARRSRDILAGFAADAAYRAPPPAT
jgi:pimeloyl-ACP methyl ester carboxylesterase